MKATKEEWTIVFDNFDFHCRKNDYCRKRQMPVFYVVVQNSFVRKTCIVGWNKLVFWKKQLYSGKDRVVLRLNSKTKMTVCWDVMQDVIEAIEGVLQKAMEFF